MSLEESQLLCRSPECGRGKFGPFTDAGTATANLKKRRDLLGKNAFPGHARVPLRVIQAISSQMPNAPKNFLFAIWKMFLQPVFKQRGHRPRQTNNRVAGELRAGSRARFQNLRDFVVG